MVAERGDLGLLQVGVARDRGLGVTLRDVGQQRGEPAQIVATRASPLSQIQTQIEGHLVVARSPGVKLLADLPDQFDQPALDCRMNILIGVEEDE